MGVLAGIAAGALTGVLFAPEKGKDARRKLSKTGEDYADALKDKFDVFFSGVTEKFDQVKVEVFNLT